MGKEEKRKEKGLQGRRGPESHRAVGRVRAVSSLLDWVLPDPLKRPAL